MRNDSRLLSHDPRVVVFFVLGFIEKEKQHSERLCTCDDDEMLDDPGADKNVLLIFMSEGSFW